MRWNVYIYMYIKIYIYINMYNIYQNMLHTVKKSIFFIMFPFVCVCVYMFIHTYRTGMQNLFLTIASDLRKTTLKVTTLEISYLTDINR